jgi:ABC-2 type transport system ATP-binding protein
VAAVEVEHLVKRYAGLTAIADVSFTAAAGEVTAVLGRNGAGKTTTIEVCAGLRHADGGSVRVLGLDPRRDATALHPRVGTMPQGGSGASGVYPAARPAEILRLYASLYAAPLPLAPLVERLGLGHVLRTPWRRLSGGEQQRLSFALAIIGRPEVAFLDEPTAGLDVTGRHAMWDLVRDLRVSGVAVVLTTHTLDEAESLADRVTIIADGRIAASGSPAELTASAGGTDTLHVDAPAGLPTGRLDAALPPGVTVAEPTPGRYVVTGPITPAIVASVTAWCADLGVLPDRITTGGRTLEEVFLAVTGSPAGANVPPPAASASATRRRP